MTTTPTSRPADPWLPLEPAAIAELFAGTEARWWLSGGVALEHWLGRPIRDHDNVDVSTIPTDLQALLADLPEPLRAWGVVEGRVVPFDELPPDADVQPVLLRDESRDAWVLQVKRRGRDADPLALPSRPTAPVAV